jgi:benzoate membrane transport protein
MHSIRTLWADSSLSAVVAGLIAVVVSFSGPSVLVFQAAHAAHFSAAQTSSWLWAIAAGSGLTGLVLSLRHRAPVIIAWSTPGAALLVATLPGYSPGEAVTAYLAGAALIVLLGVSGVFDALMRRLPASIAAAMLAGILFRFGAEAFVSIGTNPTLVLGMFLSYLLMRRFKPRYAIVAVLAVGLLIAGFTGQIVAPGGPVALAVPELIRPEWSWRAVFNLGLPLALVGLTGQYVPGMAVLRASGYATPSRPIVCANGLMSLLLAPFGAHGINPAAITAAICTGEEAHADPARRYVAGVACGVFYLFAALGGGALAVLFACLPHEWVVCLSGLALFGAIGSGLTAAVADDAQREPALITFLLTASGMSFLGLGAAFWGILAGLFAWGVLSLARPRTPVAA